jgi:trehalose 6-phosphate phosphatase
MPPGFGPRTRQGRAGIAAILRSPSDAVVGLDFDGTLSPIVADPRAAYAHPMAAPVLRRLAPRLSAVVIVTGRPVAEAVALGGFADVPGLVILGQYGLQRWSAGAVEEPPPAPGVTIARDRLPGLLRDAPDGVWVEDKGHALAVHTRRAADPESAFARLEPPLRALADETGLRLEPGRLVLELRPQGVDKGAALRGFLAERDAHAVLYAGDDLGDLPAFAAVEALRETGLPGVTVCSGSAEVTELAARADLVVDGPDGVVSMLGALADALG